jgi:hypothetical protein
MFTSLLLLLACKEEEKIEYDRFNASADALGLEVGAPEVLDPVAVDLHSSTGEIVVGYAEVDPGGGPIGTEHDMVVVVYDDYQDDVDRVSVRIESPDRGEDEYDLIQDSADEGYYKIRLESQGAEGEQRTDTLTFRLWSATVVATEE